MHTTYRIVLAATCVSVAAAPAFARQLAGAAGQRPIGQASSANRVAELARQNTAGIICRGGPGLSIETRSPSPNGSAVQDMVTLSLSFRRVERPAGVDGRALDPGTCSIVDRVLGPMEPGRIQFETSANAQAKQAIHGGVVDTSANAAERYVDAKTIPAYLNDPNHYWRFDAVRNTGGYFTASANGPVKPATLTEQPFIGSNPAMPASGPGSMRQGPGALNPLSPAQNPTKAAAALPGNLFQMDDRAIIVIGGTQVTAGEVKRDILQNMEPPSGPAKTFSAPPRRGMGQIPSTTTTLSAANGPSLVLQQPADGVVGGGVSDRYREAATIDCTRGPIAGRLQGRITPGERFTISGACFGDQLGAIELIGQFAGGRQRLDFFSWKDSEIVAATPPVQGAPDHVVSFTVIRADGKRSMTKQANFVAAREHVEVPSAFWSPSSHFTWTGVATDGYNMFTDNFSGSHSTSVGPIPPATFRLHVNPACWLDSMDATPRIGAVTDILGWQNSGPPNDASVTILWRSRQTRTVSKYVTGNDSKTVYEIEFDLRAWASCPVGIKP